MIKEIILQYCKDGMSEDIKNYVSRPDFIYSIYPFTLYVRDQILEIIHPHSNNISNIDCFADDLTNQIVLYTKENILSLILIHELQIANEEGILEGITNKDKFSDFIFNLSCSIEWINYLLEKYPVLQSRIELFCNNTFNFIRQILSDFNQDKNSLLLLNISAEEKIDSLELFLGDSHSNGQFVTMVILKNNKIIYKPRNAKNEIAFKNTVSYFNQLGITINVKTPLFFEKKDHTWFEFIEYKNIQSQEEIIKYYNNLGRLQCLFYILGTCDIIPDNIITSEGTPYIIDIEALFTKPKSFSFSENINGKFSSSVIKTGILPQWIYSGNNERGIISSILFPYNSQILAQKVWGNISDLELSTKTQLYPISKNEDKHLPQFENRKYAMEPKYLDEFIKGFVYFYEATIAHKKDIEKLILDENSFLEVKNRVILHPTLLYQLLMNELKIPEYMQGKLSIIDKVKYILESENINDEENKLCNSLTTQLYNLDIPFFYFNKQYLYDGYGNYISDYEFENLRAKELILQNINNLNDKDLKFQVNIISASIKCGFEFFKMEFSAKSDFVSLPSKSSLPKSYLDIAVHIGDELYNSIESINGEINWIGKNRNVLDGRYEVMPMNQDLYDGNIGIAVFFIYLSKYTKNTKYEDIALKIYENLKSEFRKLQSIEYYDKLPDLRKDFFSLSVFSYPMSLLYLMLHLPNEKHDEKLMDDILFEVSKMIQKTNQFDLFFGVAGFLDFIFNIKGKLKNERYSELVSISIKSLLSNLIETEKGIVWKYYDAFNSMNELYLGGYAHGTAGIANVLYKASIELNDKSLEKIADKVLQFDRSFYNPQIKGWQDSRDKENIYDAGSWCHGAAGIGLSRILISQYKSDIFLQDEIKIAANKIIETGFGGNQSICHGDMGNLEILFAISKRSNDLDTVKLIQDILSQIGSEILSGKKIRCGDSGNLGLNGLYLGLAGVGYQYLRFFDWEYIPSLLCPEIPTALNKHLH